MKIYILLLTLVITGCAPAIKPITYTPVEAFDLNKLKSIPYHILCQDYYTMSKQGQLTTNSRSQFENVLKEKGLSEKELIKIREGTIYIGMSQCGLYAAWGKPVDENTTVNKYSKRIQHIYGYSLSSKNYVYTVNGKITSWQN